MPERRGHNLQELKKLLLAERDRLEKIAKIAVEQLRIIPEGTLRVSKFKGYTQYYHCTKENKAGRSRLSISVKKEWE